MTTPEPADSGPDTGHDSEYDTASELNRVLTSAPMDSSLVRVLVRAYAAALREIGLLPEQMLIRVKSLVEPSLMSGPPPRGTSADMEWQRLRITRWAVESYFGIPERDDERDGVSEDDRIVS
ncbi:MAG: hypothetical protein ACYC2G_11340 [Gemmatimonadaceae bacterium]